MVQVRGVWKWCLLVLLGLLALVGLLLTWGGGERDSVQAAACWKAEITEQWTDVDLAGSVLRVSVQGKGGLPVIVRSRGDFQTVGYAGTKPEYGPSVAEFAPLSRGIYFIEPQGLGYVFEVWLDGKNYTRVDFTPLPCAPTPTATPRSAMITPRPAVVATATSRPVATAVRVPPPVRAPLWQGRVVEHLRGLEGRYFATIAVRVIGRPAGQEVEIRSNGWSASCKTGTKPEIAPDACEFGALNAGTYRLTPRDLGANVDVSVGLRDFALVEFYYIGPPPRTRWVGHVVENTSSVQSTEHVNSAITVIVSGRPWHEVEIRSDGWSTTAKTGHKPEYGSDACEFGGLRASTYTITPKDLGTSLQVTVDGWGWALVRFDEVPLPAPILPTVPPLPTSTPSRSAAAPAGGSQPAQIPATGPTASPQPSPTPKGAGWWGWVVSNSSGDGDKTGISSTIVVRVLNWPGVPVIIDAGGDWNATCITGTKLEHGPDACDFGGLWPSTYRLRPEGANIEVEVTMDGLGTAFVEFAAPQ